MNSADMVVCGVHEDVLIEDIAILVPKGQATTIPGRHVVNSKDLYRKLSQGKVFRLNVHSLLQREAAAGAPSTSVVETDESLRQERDTLKAHNESLVAEIAKLKKVAGEEKVQLKEQVRTLEAEVATLRQSSPMMMSKLDEVLAQLKAQPAQVVVQAAQVTAKREKEADDAPIFIPSQIRPETTDPLKVISEESTSTGSKGVAQATNALRKLKTTAQ